MADTPSRPPVTNPDADALGTPYGPHPRGVDEAAGGADSSPFENEAREVQRDASEASRRKGQTPQSDPANKPADRSP
jgi:hypothetical protein